MYKGEERKYVEWGREGEKRGAGKTKLGGMRKWRGEMALVKVTFMQSCTIHKNIHTQLPKLLYYRTGNSRLCSEYYNYQYYERYFI